MLFVLLQELSEIALSEFSDIVERTEIIIPRLYVIFLALSGQN
jgi:hypothetical protein